MTRSPGWRAALRIARRDALRARGRSALIVAMIALPILGMATADVLARTAQLETDEKLTRALGAADALIQVMSEAPFLQLPLVIGGGGSGPNATQVDPTRDPRPYLPAGTRTLPGPQFSGLTVRTDAGLTRTDFEGFDYSDPMAAGMVTLSTGRLPASRSEVAASPGLLGETGLSVGDRLEVIRPVKATFTIVGAIRGGNRNWARVIGLPGVLPENAKWGPPTSYFVDTPGPLTWDKVTALNEGGITAYSRAVVLDPPPDSEVPACAQGLCDDSGDIFVLITIALVGVMAVLEVVLLAGAAFAVGTRRQSRALAMVAGTGGDRRQLRRIVLAQGLVLGLWAGVIGILGGIAAAAALRPTVERLSGELMGHFDVRPLDLLAIAGLAVLSGFLAAWLPARTAARQDVVGALTGRQPVQHAKKRHAALGLVISVAGALMTVFGSSAAARSTFEQTQQISAAPYVIAGGAALTLLGLLLATPTLISLSARLGRRLPLASRMALRDADRHRGRSAPAVAAILTAVAASSGLLVFVASTDDQNRRMYQPSYPEGHGGVDVWQVEPAAFGSIQRAVRAETAVRSSTLLRVAENRCDRAPAPGCTSTWADLQRPKANQCPLWLLDREARQAEVARYANDARCAGLSFGTEGAYVSPPAFVVEKAAGTTADLAALLGRPVPQEAKDALARGGVVVFDPLDIRNGIAEISISSEKSAEPTVIQVPGAHVPVEQPLAGSFWSEEATHAAGLSVLPAKLVFSFEEVPTRDQEEAVREALTNAGLDAWFTVERGYDGNYGIGLLALMIGSAIITLGAAGIATGLALADARSDHATLAAVGAAPRIRRLLSMSQSGVLAAMGAVLGVACGFVPGIAYVWARPDMNVVIPWGHVAAAVLVVPLIAALFAGLLTRSKIPLERRIA